MPERVVVLGEDLYYSKWMKANHLKERELFASFDRYKDTWVFEQCEALGVDTDDFRDDLFRSLDDFMEFWGTEDLCDCVGSVYARMGSEVSVVDVSSSVISSMDSSLGKELEKVLINRNKN